MPGRIAIFTSRLDYPLCRAIVEIDSGIPDLSWLVVSHSPRRSAARLARSQWRNLRRNGLRWIPYQAGNVLRRIGERLRASAAPHGPARPGHEFAPASITARSNLRFLRTPDIHDDATIEAVRDFAPDLGISWGAPILRRRLFGIPPLGTFNLHQGKVPDYRGMPPAFWELWNDERHVGCTVHRVDDALDTGDIVAQASTEREEFSTLRGLQLRLDEVGIRLMRDAVAGVLGGEARPLPQPPGGHTYRKPTLAQAAALRRRLRTPSPRASRVRQAAKDAVARTALALWRSGLGAVLPPRATVLLYHRVSDSARDDLTVGIEQFDRQMALLRRFCQPIPLSDLIAGPRVQRTRRPQVCVTFDDGYLDNYLNAVPVLLRHQIPAAFFVSTGIIGTDRRFPHDVLRGNPPIPVMTWDHLRRMRDHGFLIGSHTVNHIDCAAEDPDTLLRELRESLADLQREIGLTGAVFAYPYGGRHNMTPGGLDLVRQAGYSACLSAWGGSNIGLVQPFNVLRRGIHWEFSDPAFLFECLGLT